MHIQPEWLNGFIGFVIPIVIERVKNSNWKRQYKFLVALGSCIIVGVASSYFTHNFNVADILTSIIYIFSVAEATYQLFWKQLLEGQ